MKDVVVAVLVVMAFWLMAANKPKDSH